MPKFEFTYTNVVYFAETQEEKRFEGSDTLEAGNPGMAERFALRQINEWNRLGLLGNPEIRYTYVLVHVK